MNLKHSSALCNDNEKNNLEQDSKISEAHQRASRLIMLKWLNGEELIEKDVTIGNVNPTQTPILQALHIKRQDPKNTISDGNISDITLMKTIDLIPVGTSDNIGGSKELMMVEFIGSPATQKEVQLTRFKK